MTTIPDSNPHEPGPPRDQSHHTNDPEPVDAAPGQALLEPLPSSEMFLASFAGVRPIAGRDILDPAFDLVACQCEERLAEAILTDETASLEELRTAGESLVSARTDIVMLVTIIDDAVREWLKARCHGDPTAPVLPVTPNNKPRGVVVHTESVGDIAARMAELWGLLNAYAPDVSDPPEAVLLMELCDGYDALAAEIESGRRLPAGV
ncbi:hypothetical protein [Nocardia fluminea]|uniref:hypothetical protein n=1 Tax=Nocardia fluminea TaxID=134984 RepID=UPI0036511866